MSNISSNKNVSTVILSILKGKIFLDWAAKRSGQTRKLF